MKLNFIWKKKVGRYESGESLYSGKIRVANYSWNTSRTQGSNDPNNWAGYIALPSLADSAKRIFAIDEEGIKRRIEEMVTKWFEEFIKPK